jgi:DNA invertase Pin-like site-specific DNA recombinase
MRQSCYGPCFVFRTEAEATPLGAYEGASQRWPCFAEFERALIQERVRAGLARAKTEGKRLGRPRIDERTERAVQAALAKKNRPGVRKIAAALGVAVGTVQRIGRELRS